MAAESGMPGDPGDGATFASASASPPDGRRIDRYRLLQQVGEGGMGEVWLAEQTAPVRVPQPVVIDFGLVKALQHRLTDRTLFTELGVNAGFRDADWIAQDADLESLHGDPAFEALVERARRDRSPD